MKIVVTGVAALIVIAATVGETRADGKFYWRESVPPGIPYQRAFLIFHEGTETLLVQSKYRMGPSSDVNTIGWIVPVPGVPDIASMEPADASQLFSSASWQTGPRVWRISGLVALALILAFVGGLLLLVASAIEGVIRVWLNAGNTGWQRRLAIGFFCAVFSLIALLACAPRMMRKSQASTGVDVVRDEQVGIYDVKVIKGDNAEPVMAWLTENGFHVDDRDKAVFADYVSRGWCFTAAKVRPEVADTPKATDHEGLAAPLVLKFPTDKPIYPLALTAGAGTPTEILLYTASAAKLTCGRRLPLLCARESRIEANVNVPLIRAGDREGQLFDGVPAEKLMLCKFKGTLSPAQMKEDLVLAPASDNTPYRKTKFVW